MFMMLRTQLFHLSCSPLLALLFFYIVFKVDDPEILPHYPYRDDAMLIHKAICDYVRDVVTNIYSKIFFFSFQHFNFNLSYYLKVVGSFSSFSPENIDICFRYLI